MAPPRSSDVTGLLLPWRRGDAAALDRLLPAIYFELHYLAHLKSSRLDALRGPRGTGSRAGRPQA